MCSESGLEPTLRRRNAFHQDHLWGLLAGDTLPRAHALVDQLRHSVYAPCSFAVNVDDHPTQTASRPVGAYRGSEIGPRDRTQSVLETVHID